MDNRTSLYCSALRAGLWGTLLERHLDKDEFQDLWKDANRQTTKGLIASALVQSEAVPLQVVDRLQDWLLKIAGQNLKMDSVLSQSLNVLKRNGIEPVLLKGQGAASYYREPMLRESGDIDLYVGRDLYQKSFEILSELSGTPEAFEFEEHSKHSHVEIDGITVEIHRFSEVLPRKYDPFYQKVATEGLSSKLKTLIVEDFPVQTPEPVFNAFFLFNHLWRHLVTEGVGFRQVCDWTMFLHANTGSIDNEKLYSILKPLDLVRPWQVIGRVAIDVLGLPASEMPLDNPAYSRYVEKVVGMMMKEGNFGHEREDWLTVPRETFFDNVHVFFMIAHRYSKLLPIFGKVVLNEYLDRMRRKFFS